MNVKIETSLLTLLVFYSFLRLTVHARFIIFFVLHAHIKYVEKLF